MGNTSFEEIYKLFLNSIQDYELKHLFQYEISIAEDMLEMYLLKAIPKFKVCRKNIRDVDLDNKTFYDNLDLEEKVILSDLMVLTWFERLINDITYLKLKLDDLDFKHKSEAENLKQLSEYSDRVREKVDYNMLQYDLHSTPFSQWARGEFSLWK